MTKSYPFILLFLGFLFFPTFSLAEGYTRDSLYQVWEETSRPDTVRLKAMGLWIKKHYSGRKPDSAQYYGQIMLREAEGAKSLFYQAVALQALGNASFLLSVYDKAQDYHEKAFDIFQNLGKEKELSTAYNALGLVNQSLGNYDLALEQFEKGIELNYQYNDSIAALPNLLNMAKIYETKGDILKSLELNLKSLQISQHKDFVQKRGIAHNNLANNYKYLGDLPKAVHHYLEARNIYERTNNSWALVGTLNNLGLLLIENEDYPKAKKYLDEALEISVDADLFQEQIMSLFNLSVYYKSLEQYKETDQSLRKALEIIEDKGFFFMKPFAEIEIGNNLINMGRIIEAERFLNSGFANKENGRAEDKVTAFLYMSYLKEKQNKWQEAESYAEQGYELAQELKKQDLTALFPKQLVNIYKHFGRNAEALEMYEKQIALEKSVFNEENSRAVINQEYQYSYTQKAYQDSLRNEAKLKIQTADLERRKMTNWFLIGILLLIGFFGVVLVNRYRIIQEQKRVIAVEKNNSEEANAKLKEIDQSKSRFFTNISHEFRTPLTVISGMLDQITEPARAKELIRRNTDQLLNLINQILDLRKLESGNLSLNLVQGNIVKFLRYGTESFESLAVGKSIKLSFQSDLEEVLMDYDQDKLLKIQMNLISNAIKFTPEGGKISVTVEKESDEKLKIIFEDTGRGISEEKLPYIFDRFYQVDGSDTREGEGTGIGLALTKELVHLMNGKIQVESELNKGTKLSLLLPITQKAALEAEKSYSIEPIPIVQTNNNILSTSSASVQNGEKPSLLIIEDNPDIVEYLYTCLEDQYDLFSASDGQEGIEAAFEQIPDLIISDVMMPRKNGYEVCETLKLDERTSHIPIVMLTAKADQASKIEGYKRGADAYLSKPFNQEELFIRLKKLLEIRQTLQLRYQGGIIPSPSNDPIIQVEDEFLIKAREYIFEKIDDSNYRGESLGKDIGMSRASLHRKIKALTGLSTSHFIRSIRVEYAKELLKNPDLQIATVTYQSGFNHPAYFNRVFNMVVGKSPREWREENM